MAKKNKKKNIPVKRKIFLFYVKLLILGKILFSICFALFFFTDYLDFIKNPIKKHLYGFTSQRGLVIRNLIIEGEKNLSTKDISSALKYKPGDPLLSVDLDETRRRLEKLAWVKEAAVGRKWPESLYIGIVERKPIALLKEGDKFFLIDETGFKISSETRDIERFPGLLPIYGEDAGFYAKALISDLEKYPDIYSKVISAVRYGNRRWNLNLIEKITVKMPEKNFSKALDYLARISSEGKLVESGFKIFDLRDSEKYYFSK